jgi:hypothetical protein
MSDGLADGTGAGTVVGGSVVGAVAGGKVAVVVDGVVGDGAEVATGAEMGTITTGIDEESPGAVAALGAAHADNTRTTGAARSFQQVMTTFVSLTHGRR